MRKINRFFSVVLVMILLVNILPLGVFTASAETYSGTCGNNLTWNLDTSTGVLTISGTGDMSHDLFFKAPWYYCRNYIKNIVIENGVTSIGNYAFDGCNGLTSVIIPDSVTSIGGWAFRDCTELTSIVIPNSVTSIDNGTFYGCTGLTSVTIPDSVTEIRYYAFEDCTGLTSVVIPDSVTVIYVQAFSGCTGLTSVTIPDSVNLIDDNVFYGCTGLTSVTIGNSVTSIGFQAFCKCTGLTSIVIPNSVTSIGDYAFSGCDELKTVYYCGTKEQWDEISIGSMNDELISAEITNHNFCDEWQISYSNCTEKGIESRACAVCGFQETREIAALGHSFVNGICTRCGFYQKPIFVSKTDTSVTLQAADGFEYSKDGEIWQKSNTFTGLTPNTSYTFYQRFKKDGSDLQNETSEALTVKTKDSAQTPEPPVATYVSDDTVIIGWSKGYEYSIDGELWQDNNIFSGLTPNTTYTFYQRVKETDTVYRSASSVATVTTEKRVTVVAENKTEGAGRFVTLDFTLKDNPGISTGKFTVWYDPDNLTLTDIALSGNFSNAFAQYYGNTVSFVSEKDISGEQTLLTLSFKINWKADEGDAEIYLTDTQFFNYAEEIVVLKSAKGVINIIQHTPGDITGDEIVDMRDASRLLKYLNHETNQVDEYALDVNGDGEVNGKDLVRIMKYLNQECSENEIF